MVNLISNILLFCLICTLPFGELLRFQFNNGIALSAIDIVLGNILVFTIVRTVKNRNYLSLQLLQPIVLFAGVCIASLLINSPFLTPFHVFVSSLYIIRWVSLASVYFFIAHLEKKMKNRIPYFMTASGFFVVIFGFMQYFLYPNLNNLRYLGWDEHYLRLFSTFFDPNFAGIFMVLSFLFSLHLWIKILENKKIILGLVFGMINLLTCIAIFLTLSRDTFITLLVGLLFYLFLQTNKRYFSIFGTIVFLFIFFIFFLSKLPTEGAHMFRLPSSVARITEARRALTIFSEHPIIGVGFNAYRYAQLKHGYLSLNSWETSHAAAGTDNSFLFVLATTGIVGFIAYVYLLYKMFRVIIYKKKSDLSLVVAASLTAILVSSLFVNSLFYTPIMGWLWILIGLIEHT